MVDGRGRRILTALSEDRLRRVLGHLLDEGEFLSPHGIRALSKFHAEHPFALMPNTASLDVLRKAHERKHEEER